MNTILILMSGLILSAHAELAQDQNILRLKELVSINSGSANLKGVTAVQEKLKPWFEELGFKVELRPNPKGQTVSGPMLVATLPGESPEAVTLIMHADTVFEPTSPFQKWEIKDENLMKGPGVIDDKSGIILALQGIKDYLTELKAKGQTPKHTLQVEVTPNEEVGAIGWWETFEQMSRQSFMVLSFEPSVKGGLVEGRKGNVWYEISVKGKEAHAGVHHEDGVNACAILSQKIVELEKLTDYKRKVTVSIGHIEGGQDKYNIVCGWAKAKLDTRIPDRLSRDKLNQRIESILNDPRVSFKIIDETAPLSLDPASKPYLKRVLSLIESVEGTKNKTYFSGGVGDANHFARKGLIVVDGMGAVGDFMHTTDEFIDLRSISTRAKVLTQFLLSL